MVPVFKGKGEDRTDYAGYRPVSVLPVLSQLFERVLRARLVGFLDRHRVIIPGQYGFRSGHSTAMAVLDMAERVRAAAAACRLGGYAPPPPYRGVLANVGTARLCQFMFLSPIKS